MFKNALVSCSDKTGLEEFIKNFAQDGLRIVSTGGTAKQLKAAGFDVVDVAEQTGFPEVMDGRVKTLHPRIHMCLLGRADVEADKALLDEQDLQLFDLVIGNLYPFEDSLDFSLFQLGEQAKETIEKIDIGGPSFLRAAAKNYRQTAVICDPSDYAWVAQKKSLSLEDRQYLASKVFSHISVYDGMISQALQPAKNLGEKPTHSLGGYLQQSLRYGENPHQQAGWFRQAGLKDGWQSVEQLQGKELSYNNLSDLDAAVKTLISLSQHENVCVSVKHNNPCGVAQGSNPGEAVELSLAADPMSVFGGIIACNFTIDEQAADALTGLFLECVVAPGFTAGALEKLAKKKNFRVLKWPSLEFGKTPETHLPQIKTILGGFLVQSPDKVSAASADWKYIGGNVTDKQKEDLEFAWSVCANLKSNAIAITSGRQTLGLGMGQVNRVEAVEQAIARAKKHHPGQPMKVLASDAFFPFADSVELAAAAGVEWIIQPGGSIKDDEVIAKANELGVNMVMTGQRHFSH